MSINSMPSSPRTPGGKIHKDKDGNPVRFIRKGGKVIPIKVKGPGGKTKGNGIRKPKHMSYKSYKKEWTEMESQRHERHAVQQRKAGSRWLAGAGITAIVPKFRRSKIGKIGMAVGVIGGGAAYLSARSTKKEAIAARRVGKGIVKTKRDRATLAQLKDDYEYDPRTKPGSKY